MTAACAARFTERHLSQGLESLAARRKHEFANNIIHRSGLCEFETTMDLSQLIDPGSVPGIVVVCGVMCVIGVVLLIGLQFLGTIFGFLGGFLDLGIDVITGGPITWCGCLVVLAVLVICGGTVLLLGSALGSCGTPNAVNLCSLFGR